MSELRPNEQFVVRTAELARRAPEEWKAFTEEFRRWVDQRRSECVTASSDHVQIAQGMARAGVQLLEQFETAAKTADRIKNGRG